jgi:hypothetical protein
MKFKYLVCGILAVTILPNGTLAPSLATSPKAPQCGTDIPKDLPPKSALKTETIFSEIPVSQNDPNPPNQDVIFFPTKEQEQKVFYIGIKVTNTTPTPYTIRRAGHSLHPQILPNPIILRCGQSVNFTSKGTLIMDSGIILYDIEKRFSVPLTGGFSFNLDKRGSDNGPFMPNIHYSYDDIDEVNLRLNDPKMRSGSIPGKFSHHIKLMRTEDARSLLKQEIWCSTIDDRIEKATDREEIEAAFNSFCNE